MDNYKTCKECLQSLPTTEFHKRLDGFQNRCKSCTKTYTKARYQANAEELRARSREYRLKNPEKVRAARLDWKRRNHSKNVESVLKYQRKYPEKHIQWTKEYRNRNKDKYRNYSQIRRIREINNGVYLITDKDLMKLLNQACASCGSFDNPSIDHIIPISLGGTHSIGNLQTLCISCNSSKGNKVMTIWKKRKL